MAASIPRRPSPPASVRVTRLDGVDALRGVAVAMMIAYHFCYDLTWYGYAHWRMLDEPGWILWRSAIVTTFLFVVGVSLALRRAFVPDTRAFTLRWLQIAGAAALVSLATWIEFGPRFVYFGILHFIALAVLIGRMLIPLGPWNLALGAVALLLGWKVSDPMFAPRVLNWIGFSPVKPGTEDYVPVFPWIGVVLIGLGLGDRWRRRGFPAVPGLSTVRHWLPGPIDGLLRWFGRHSLAIYLVHQPILIGALWLVTQLVR